MLMYKAACNAARASTMTSRADHIRTHLQQTSCDTPATWQTAQSLANRMSSTTTRNARTSSASSVCSSLTRSDASGTTSRRRYSSARLFADAIRRGSTGSCYQSTKADIDKLTTGSGTCRMGCNWIKLAWNTATHLRAVSSLKSVSFADVDARGGLDASSRRHSRSSPHCR